jgi:hypothetical protein
LRKWEEKYSWLNFVPSNVYVSSASLAGVIPTADNILFAQKGVNERKGIRRRLQIYTPFFGNSSKDKKKPLQVS